MPWVAGKGNVLILRSSNYRSYLINFSRLRSWNEPSGWDIAFDRDVPRVLPCFRHIVGELHAQKWFMSGPNAFSMRRAIAGVSADLPCKRSDSVARRTFKISDAFDTLGRGLRRSLF
jgi:hypothetical protein